jgi:hypothetical protein
MSVWDESQRSGLVILTTGVQKIRRKIPLSFSHFKAEQAQPNHSYNIPFNGALRKEKKNNNNMWKTFFFLFGGSSRSCAQTPKPPDWCFFTSLTYKFRYKENKLRRKTLTENQLEWYHLSSRKPHKKKKMTAKIFSESIYVSLYKDNELSTTHIHTHKAGYYNQEEC